MSIMIVQATAIGAPKLLLEVPPVLSENEVVVPLEVLTLLLLGRCFYDTTPLTKVWRAEVELFLEILLDPSLEFGSTFQDLKGPLRKKAQWALPRSQLKYFGLYGQNMVDKEKILGLKNLRGECLVRDEKAPYSGATSLKETVSALCRPSKTQPRIEDAKFYSRNSEAIQLGEVLNKLCRLAREGVPPSLKNFEIERDVQGVIWSCFESVYSRACVKVERDFLQAILDAFRLQTAGMDYILFQPLYQIVYARDKSLAQLQPSVGMWLTLFGQQGSETSYAVHRASQWIERDDDLRCFPLGEKWPFFLKQVQAIGEYGKYPGIYLFYKHEGQFAVGSNSFHPANFPAQAFVLGGELRNLPDWAFPTLKGKYKGRAWNALVSPNPITKPLPKKPQDAKPSAAFMALSDKLKEQHYQWSSSLTPLLQEALKAWAESRDKEYLFPEKIWEPVLKTLEGCLEKAKNIPLRLKAPLQEVLLENSDRRVWNQGHQEQKATDTALNIIAQTALLSLNQVLGDPYSGYLPGTTPLNVMQSLQKTLGQKKPLGLFNVDVVKAFDSIDLCQNVEVWDRWLQRCDVIVRRKTSEDTARCLRNIFLPFVQRVRQGFYANDTIAPGRTPLGLTMGPSFWVYISLPLAEALSDAKDLGICDWATITGDDTLAVFNDKADADAKAKVWSVYQDFSALGFSFHHFKNFDLKYKPENPVTTEGPFAHHWPKDIPVVHAGLAVHKHLIYVMASPAKVGVQDLFRQAKYGTLNFPTNILRLAQANGHFNCPTNQTSSSANHHAEFYSDMSLGEFARKKDVGLFVQGSTTHGGLLLHKSEDCLPILKTHSYADTDDKKELRAKTAQEMHNYMKSGVRVADSNIMYQGLKKRLLDGFPELSSKDHPHVQSCFGDAEAVMLAITLRNPKTRFRSIHGVKMKRATQEAKRCNYKYRFYKRKGMCVPLTKLAMEHPKLIFRDRHKQMSEPGTVLGPSLSVYYDHDEGGFKRSKQSLQILGRKGSQISAPTPNAELYGVICTITQQRGHQNLRDEDVAREVLRIFETLEDDKRRFFKETVEDHINRVASQDKNLQRDLENGLGSPEGGYVLVQRAWKKSAVVRSILTA